jgi:hypothetical protein
MFATCFTPPEVINMRGRQHSTRPHSVSPTHTVYVLAAPPPRPGEYCLPLLDNNTGGAHGSVPYGIHEDDLLIKKIITILISYKTVTHLQTENAKKELVYVT